jgi:hypothetical protein
VNNEIALRVDLLQKVEQRRKMPVRYRTRA